METKRLSLPKERAVIVQLPEVLVLGWTEKIDRMFTEIEPKLEFESAKIVRLTDEQIRYLLPSNKEGSSWLSKSAMHILRELETKKMNPKLVFGSSNPEIIGNVIYQRYSQHYGSGPVRFVCFVGVNAREIAHKRTGSTSPHRARQQLHERVTVRGLFSNDNFNEAIMSFPLRPCMKLLHTPKIEGDASDPDNEVERTLKLYDSLIDGMGDMTPDPALHTWIKAAKLHLPKRQVA